MSVVSKGVEAGPVRTALAEVPSVVGLALPIVAGLAAATLIGVVDTVMIAPLGTDALAAAALTSAALIVLFSALYGLVSVMGIAMAQGSGAADAPRITAELRTGLVVAALAGVLCAAAMAASLPLLSHLGQPPQVLDLLPAYWLTMAGVLVPFSMLYVFKGLFEAVGRPWTAAAFAMLGVALNVPLNWVLIHGLGGWGGLGLWGAGIASVAAESAALLAAWLWWRRGSAMAPYRGRAQVTLARAAEQLREGVPVAVGYVGEGGAYAMVGVMFGWFGAQALAAHQIVGSIGGVLYMVPLGMAAAVGIRIGQAAGAGRMDRLRSIGLAAIGTVVLWMSAVTGLLLLLREDVARALSDSPEVVAVASAMFLTVAFMQVADGVQSTSLGALRGLVDNRVPIAVSLVASWAVSLPAALALGFAAELGPVGVWIGYGLGLAAAAFLLLRRFLRRTAHGASRPMA
jgi:MATE family multidrug resistance protein